MSVAEVCRDECLIPCHVKYIYMDSVYPNNKTLRIRGLFSVVEVREVEIGIEVCVACV